MLHNNHLRSPLSLAYVTLGFVLSVAVVLAWM